MAAEVGSDDANVPISPSVRGEAGAVGLLRLLKGELDLNNIFAIFLPPEVAAAAIADVAACVAAFRDIPLTQGQNVCIFGAGPVGNICTQYLVSKGLQVTTTDSNAANLALLQKYDTDTLITPGPLEKYEYLVDAGGDGSAVLASDSTAGGHVVALDTNFGATGKPLETDWTEAIQLVHRGVINLEEHAEDVAPLEDYQDVWAKSRSKSHFKSLIRVSDDLGAL